MPKVSIQLPPVLRAVSGSRLLEAEGATILEAVLDLAGRMPALALHLLDEQNEIRHNIVFLHDGEAIRAKRAGERAVADEDEIVITNALAGG